MKIALGVPLRKKFKIEIIELQKKLQQLLQSKSKFLFCKKISHCSCIVLNCITWNAHFLHIHHRMFKTYLASYQWRKQEKLSRGHFLQSPLSSPPPSSFIAWANDHVLFLRNEKWANTNKCFYNDIPNFFKR